MSAFTLNTVYKAIDKYSPALKAMQRNTQKFADKTAAGLAKVERAERRLTKGFGNLMGKAGQLGIAIGGLAIGRDIIQSNMQVESSLASLSAITGVTGSDFKAFESEIDRVSKKQKKFAGETAAAFEVVGSAKPELLGNAKALADVTDAAMILSKASKDDLTTSAKNLTGTMNQFNLAADQSQRVINTLAAGSVVGAANISEVTEAMKNVGTVANDANVGLERTVAGIEVLAKFQLKGAEAGTKFRGVLLKLQKAGLGYASGQFDINDALAEYNKTAGKFKTAAESDAYAAKIFGAENITAGKILANNIDLLNEYTKGVTGTNTAMVQAGINSDTLKNRFDELVAAFRNSITTTNSQSAALAKIKGLFVVLADNMDRIIAIVTTLIAVFAAYKIGLIATKAAIVAYNIVLGISQVRSATLAASVGGGTVAMYAQAAASYVVMGAQYAYNAAMVAAKFIQLAYTATLAPAIAATWAFTAALLANPITWVVLAVAALIAGIVLLVRNWSNLTNWVKTSDNFFARMIRFTLIPLKLLFKGIGMAINWIKERWQAVKEAFKTGGFLAGIKAIGKSILSFLLKPVELLLQGLSKIPGIGSKFEGKLQGIQEFRAQLEGKTPGETGTPSAVEPVNIPAAQTAVQTERLEEIRQQNLNIELSNRTDKDVNVKSNQGNIPVISNTY